MVTSGAKQYNVDSAGKVDVRWCHVMRVRDCRRNGNIPAIIEEKLYKENMLLFLTSLTVFRREFRGVPDFNNVNSASFT